MNVVAPLVEDGYVVYGYDHRGHGKSPGPRVHIHRWSEYREDLRTYLTLVAEQVPDQPIIVYGHSMGSLVVLDLLLQRPQGLAGAIISGVAIEPAGVGSPAKMALARILSGVVPRLSVGLGIDARALTCDPKALEAYRADPLCTGSATVRWGAESLKAVDRVKEGMGRVDVPLLVLHGEADPLNLAEGARLLHEAASHPDKTLRVYPGVRHEPHNDLGHEQVAGDIREWLARMPRV
jgi:alpha-beta hydrolase superfamily lysophospholipase